MKKPIVVTKPSGDTVILDAANIVRVAGNDKGCMIYSKQCEVCSNMGIKEVLRQLQEG